MVSAERVVLELKGFLGKQTTGLSQQEDSVRDEREGICVKKRGVVPTRRGGDLKKGGYGTKR